METAVALWLRRYGGRALPDDVEHLASLLRDDDAGDDTNVILDAVRVASFADFVAAVTRSQQ